MDVIVGVPLRSLVWPFPASPGIWATLSIWIRPVTLYMSIREGHPGALTSTPFRGHWLLTCSLAKLFDEPDPGVAL